MTENYSVLMSVYIKEKPEYLKEAITSILNQTVKTNDFVIVCDGHLTEGLNKVIADFVTTYSGLFNFYRLEPVSYTHLDYTFLLQVEGSLGYPMVIKENKGSFGEQVYLVNSYYEAVDKIKEIGHHEFIMQEFIESSKGKDVRIHVVGDEIVTAMERVNENDFRANITNGGKMKKYTPTKEQAQMAIDVCRELNLDFAGVDIMFGKEGEPVLCEVNSNAHFKNIYDCTGVNVAESILDYIVKSIKD